MTLAERLQKAIDARGAMNAHRLHRRLHDHTGGARGSSYGSVRDLLAGRVEQPSDGILEALASILGVRLEWLESGDGPMKEGAATHSSAGGSATTTGHADMALAEALQRVIEGDPLYRDLEPWVDLQTAYLQLAFELATLEPTVEEDELAAFLRGITWIIHSPWGLLNAGTTALTKKDTYAHYIRAMLGALRLAQPAEGDVDPGYTRAVIASYGAMMDDQVAGEEDDDAEA